MEKWAKEHGRRFDHEERVRKRHAREPHHLASTSQNLRGLKAKQFAEKRRKEKIQLKKKIRATEQKDVKTAEDATDSREPLPQYLLDRGKGGEAKALSSKIKEKRNEKAAKVRWEVAISLLREC